MSLPARALLQPNPNFLRVKRQLPCCSLTATLSPGVCASLTPLWDEFTLYKLPGALPQLPPSATGLHHRAQGTRISLETVSTPLSVLPQQPTAPRPVPTNAQGGKCQMPHSHPVLSPHSFCTCTWRESGNHPGAASPDQVSCPNTHRPACPPESAPMGCAEVPGTCWQLGAAPGAQLGRERGRLCHGHQPWALQWTVTP